MSQKEPKVTKQHFVGELGLFYEGLAVAEVNGEQFHILPSGQPAYSERYERAEYFQNGLAWVKEKKGRWKRIDKTGKEIFSNQALPRI